MLAAYDLQQRFPLAELAVVVFGAPRVGRRGSARRDVLRVVALCGRAAVGCDSRQWRIPTHGQALQTQLAGRAHCYEQH